MRVIVIGGEAAGMSAAARARRLDPELDIIVLEKGAVVSYAACGLPYFVEGRVRHLDDLIARPVSHFREKLRIDVRLNAEAAEISPVRRELLLASGERLCFDKLVVATGARPDLRGIEGLPRPNTFTLHTRDDAARLKELLGAGAVRRAAVVGAGYIGLEMADVLRSRGLRVTLHESSGAVLGRESGALPRLLAAHLARFGVEFRSGEPVRSLDGLSQNGQAPDLIVLAAGFRPNVELAAAAGIETGPSGAIRVNERMETALDGVYAAGDCAETVHLVTGKPAHIPLGTTANKMGRVAGANAAGRRERFRGVVGTSILRVCGLGVGVTGLSLEQARREGFDAVSAAVEDRDRPSYFFGTPVTVELVADRRSGRLLGGAVAGEAGTAGRINVIAAALHARLDADQFEHLDLAYAPPYANVWDPLLIAAQQLKRQLA